MGLLLALHNLRNADLGRLTASKMHLVGKERDTRLRARMLAIEKVSLRGAVGAYGLA